jgi:hypothetical protein
LLEGLTPGKASEDTDGDGIPDNWEQTLGLNAHAAADAAQIVPPGKSTGDRHRGYSYLEFYLNEMAESLVP